MINYLMIRLYWNIGSQPARAVKALLQIGKIQHQEIVMDLIKNQTRTSIFLQKNPLGQIPFIQVGTLRIGQSNAILAYLCEKYPQKLSNFYGSNLQAKAKVNQMASWYQGTLRPALFEIIRLKIYGSKKQGIKFTHEELKKAKKRVIQGLNMLQYNLKSANSGYLCTQGLTFVDLQAFFQVTNLIYYNMEDQLDKLPHCKKWFDSIQSLPQVSKIHQNWLKGASDFKKLLQQQKPWVSPRL